MGEGAPLTAVGLTEVDAAVKAGKVETLYLAEELDGFQDSNEDERVKFQELSDDTIPQRLNKVVMRPVRMGGEVKVPPTALALTKTEALARLRY
jgi:stalled ribosome rescue protein Dom34